jgi:hypothetical protein
MRIRAPFLVAAWALGAGGCLHVTTDLPGVLDLRSDGSQAPLDNAVLPAGDAVARGGVDSFLTGSGASGGPDVAIVDRQHWAISLVPVFNDGGNAEWDAALGKGALRDVIVGEQLSPAALGLTIAKECCTCGVGGLVASTLDVTGRGTRVQLVGAPAAAPAFPEPMPAPAPSPGPEVLPSSPPAAPGAAY